MDKQPLRLNELSNGRILSRVLGYLVDDIVIFSAISIAKSYYDTNFDKYYDLRDAVQYALVCHRWFDFMRPHICSTIYITGQPAHRFHESHFESTRQRRDYPESYKLWRSNINAVISMDGVRYTKQLYICGRYRIFLGVLITLLNGYGFGGVMWPNIRDVHVKGIFDFLTGSSDGDEIFIDVAHTYLSKRAPSLGNIHPTSDGVLCMLDNMFTSHRRYLDTTYFQHSTSTYFPQLTNLKLRVDVLNHTYQLVRFFAPTLRELEISIITLLDIPWHQFTDGGTDTVRFTELTTLKVDFIFPPIESFLHSPFRISTFYRREKLLFPKLHTFIVNGLSGIYVDFKDLLSSAQPRVLDVIGYPYHAPSTSCIPLKYVDILLFHIRYFAEFETGLSLVNTVDQLFSTYSEVRHANIGVPRLPNITPNWPNLISLELEIVYIDWTQLEALLKDFSHLKRLKIIQNTDMPQYNKQTSLFPTATRHIPTSPHTISLSLEEFTYQTHGYETDPNASRFIQQLFECAPSLMVIRASDEYLEGISDSITERDIEIRYTNAYPTSTLLHQY